MTDFTLFVGLDVHKKTISVAMVEAAAGAAVRFYGTIANTPTVRLRRAPAADAVGTSLRCSGAGVDPAQGRRQGEDGPAGRNDAGADAAGWTADRGMGAG